MPNIPIFEKGRHSRYSVSEALSIIFERSKTVEMCSSHPLKVRENGSFQIDVTDYSDWEDIKSDMNGVYDAVLKNCTWTLSVKRDSGNKSVYEVLQKRRAVLDCQNHYHLTQHFKRNKSSQNLVRSIFVLRDCHGQITNNCVLVQYYIRGKHDVHLVVGSHGNAKKSLRPFYPSAKSVHEASGEKLTQDTPANVYSTLQEQAGGPMEQANPGHLPQSKHQLYNIKWRMKKTSDPVDELLVYAKHNEQEIVMHHSDLPNDLWVLGDETTCSDVGKLTSSPLLSWPFSVDPTFSLGQYEVTPVVYKHLFLKSKKTGNPPVFLGPTMIHHKKDFATYKTLSSVCVTRCKDFKFAKGFVTDGEINLSRAFQADLPDATHLRCFKHFESNCKEKLRSVGIQKRKDQDFFLEKVFGKRGKTPGILDAADERELSNILDGIAADINEREQMLVGLQRANYQPSFHGFLLSHFDMMKENMICDVRRKAGLPSGARSYTNMSESMNSTLKSVKARVHAPTGKQGLSKLQFTRDIFESVIKEQRRELTLALSDMSDVYELADVAKHCKVDQEAWFDMTTEERELYVEQFNKMTVKNAFSGTSLTVQASTVEQPPDFRDLSVDLVNYLSNEFHYPIATASEIHKGVLKLINTPTAVQRKPSLDPNNNKTYEVATRRKKYRRVECTANKEHITCRCSCFKFDCICKHSIAVAETEGILEKHFLAIKKKRGTKRSRTELVAGHVDKERAGKKGARNINRYKQPAGNTQKKACPNKQQVYSELHHNDNRFVVQFLTPNAKKCKTCETDFCHRQKIIPYDLVIEHKERWYYPVQGDWGNKKASTKETSRYYHPDLQTCIKPRFPYFTNDYLHVPAEVKMKMHKSHRDLLNREFQLDL